MTPDDDDRSAAAKLTELDRLADGLVAAPTCTELFSLAGSALSQVFGIDRASIALRSDSGTRFRMIPLDIGGGPPGTGSDLPADLLAVARVIERGPLVHEPDVARSAHPDLLALAEEGMRAAVVLALEVQGRPVGALTLARRPGRDFGEDDVLLLLHIGALLGTAVEHLRAEAEVARMETERQKIELILSRRADELSAIQRMTAAVEARDLAAALDAITNEVATLRGIELCRITAVGRSGLRVVASAATHGAAFQDVAAPAGPDSPDALAVETRRPVLWRRPGRGAIDELTALLSLGVTSVFALPIMVGGEAIGALTAGSTGGHRLVTDEHIVAIDLVCRRLATVIVGPNDLIAAGAVASAAATPGGVANHPARSS